MTGFRTQGAGQHGGHPTPLNKVFVIKDGQKSQVKNPRHTTLHFKHGDHYLVMSGGGAGVGDPAERDPEAVLMDVKNGLVSVQMAKEIYKTAIDPKKMQILKKETSQLRRA